MTWTLAAGIAGLAALDSFNPATLVAVALILLGSRHRPVTEALAFVLGAFATVSVLGLLIYLGADAAADAVDDGLVWLRRVAFGLAGMVLLVSSVRSLRPRVRAAVALPDWFNPLTAVGLGVLMTGADLPNAFPYFIAIERLINADVSTVVGVLTILAYALVYCVPCLVLLGLGMTHGERVRRPLNALHKRFGAPGPVPASWKRALVYLAGAVALFSVAATA